MSVFFRFHRVFVARLQPGCYNKESIRIFRDGFMNGKNISQKNSGTRPVSYGAYSRKRRRAFSPSRRLRIQWRRFLPAVFFAAVFLFSSIKLIQYAVRSRDTKNTNRELQALYDSAGDNAATAPVPAIAPIETPAPEPKLLDTYQYIGNEMLESSKKLYEKNSDFVAWVRIPGVVSLPVVYRDNEYYLTHDFNGKTNSAGTVFLDEYHPFKADTQYLVLHGHNMHDGTMFGLLSHYRKWDYIEKHPTVYLNTLYREEEYSIVAVLLLPADPNHPDYIAYTGNRKFYTEARFMTFANDLMSKSLYWKEGEELLPSDALLSLSTCYDDDRIVIMCKRMKP